MRPLRVALHIAPAGVGRIRLKRAPPGQRFAPRRQQGVHASGQRIVRIGDEKVLDSPPACRARARRHRLHWPGTRRSGATARRIADRGFGRWPRSARPRAAQRRRDVGGVPWRNRAARRLIGAQPRLGERDVDRNAALPQHFRKRLRIGAVRARLIRRYGAGRGVEGVKRAGLGIDQREAAGEIAARREMVFAGGVEHDDARAQRNRGERAGKIRQAQRLQRDVRFMRRYWRRRREIILAFILQAAAGEIDEDDGVRPRLRRLAEEILKGAAQRLLIEIGGAGHVEAGPAQGFGDEPASLAAVASGSAYCALPMTSARRGPLFWALAASPQGKGSRPEPWRKI